MHLTKGDLAHILLLDPREDWSKVTHVGIVAHQDDLEFMCASAIAECFQSEEKNFLGVVCTDGRSSSRTGRYHKTTDEEMVSLRRQEQLEAAKIGRYFAIVQLAFQSSEIRQEEDSFHSLVSDLVRVLEKTSLRQIYTHNPFDKHRTHLTVFQAALSALKKSKNASHVESFFGAEVWRSLDWLPEDLKIRKEVDFPEEVLIALMSVFSTQTEGGKNYVEAVLGRKKANATFFESHRKDSSRFQEVFVNLMPFLDKGASWEQFLNDTLEAFRKDLIFCFKESIQWK